MSKKEKVAFLFVLIAGLMTFVTVVCCIVILDPLNVFGFGESNVLKDTPGFSAVHKTFNILFQEGRTHELVVIGGSNARAIDKNFAESSLSVKKAQIIVYTSPTYWDWRFLFNKIEESNVKHVVLFLNHLTPSSSYDKAPHEIPVNSTYKSAYLYRSALSDYAYYIFKSNVIRLFPGVIKDKVVWDEDWHTMDQNTKATRTRMIRQMNTQTVSPRVQRELNFHKDYHPATAHQYLEDMKVPVTARGRNAMLDLIVAFASGMSEKGSKVDLVFVPYSVAFWYSPIINGIFDDDKRIPVVDFNVEADRESLFTGDVDDRLYLSESGYKLFLKYLSAQAFMLKELSGNKDIRLFSFSDLYGVVGRVEENYIYDTHHYSGIVMDYIIESIACGQNMLSEDSFGLYKDRSVRNLRDFLLVVQGRMDHPEPLLPYIEKRINRPVE